MVPGESRFGGNKDPTPLITNFGGLLGHPMPPCLNTEDTEGTMDCHHRDRSQPYTTILSNFPVDSALTELRTRDWSRSCSRSQHDRSQAFIVDPSRLNGRENLIVTCMSSVVKINFAKLAV